MNKWVLAVACGITACWCEAGPVYVPLALSGQTAPGTSDTFASFDSPAITGSGRVSFSTTLNTAGGTVRALFSGSPGSSSQRIRTGDVAPGTGGATLSSFFGMASNDSGSYSFLANLSQGAGIFADNGSGLGLVARSGTADPALGTGLKYWSFSSFSFQYVSINNAGQTVYLATLEGTGVTTGNDDVMMLAAPNGTTTLIAREGNVAPGDTRKYKDRAFGPSLNHNGDLIFSSTLEGAQQSGIWHRPAATGIVTRIAATGDVAPGTGGKKYTVPAIGLGAPPSINNSGRIAYQYVLEQNVAALFQGTPDAVAPFVMTGDTAPGTVADGTFKTVAVAKLTNAGWISFVGEIGGTNVTSLNDEGVWAWNNDGIRKIVWEGESFPGLPAGVVLGIGNTTGGALAGGVSNARGWLVSTAAVNGTSVDSTNDRILYAANPFTDERLLLAREGDPFDVAPGDTRIVSGISLATFGPNAADTGRATGLNDADQLVFGLSFTDGSSGIFATTVPEPGCLALVAMLSLGWLAGRRLRIGPQR